MNTNKNAATMYNFNYNGTDYSLPLKKSKFASNMSPVHVSDYMSGKMSGIPSISTNCKVNPICIKRMLDGESVCARCFAAITESRYKELRENTTNNFYLLNSGVLPLELLPRFRNVSIVRIESFGDVASVTQAINYINICKVNPYVTFAAWTKNASIWNAAIAKEGKPDNLSLVYSSFKLNKPAAAGEYFTSDGINHFNHVFTVYDKETCKFYGVDTFVNCGARDCASCRKCYDATGKTSFSIREMLK